MWPRQWGYSTREGSVFQPDPEGQAHAARPEFHRLADVLPEAAGVRDRDVNTATNALDHEADIAKVQEWLRHANIAIKYLSRKRDQSERQSDYHCLQTPHGCYLEVLVWCKACHRQAPAWRGDTPLIHLKIPMQMRQPPDRLGAQPNERSLGATVAGRRGPE
jgi:hypothetical protein